MDSHVNSKITLYIKRIINITFILTIFTCTIIDFAITGKFTWSLYPMISVAFTWLVIMPLVHFNKRKLLYSLISLTIFIVPYLFILEKIIDGAKWFVPLGFPIAVISIIYLWIVYLRFYKFESNLSISLAILFILLIPLDFAISYFVSRYTNELIISIWDLVAWFILLIISLILWFKGKTTKIPTKFDKN